MTLFYAGNIINDIIKVNAYTKNGMPNYLQEWGIQSLTFEQDPEPIWRKRDESVKSLCDSKGVKWIEKISHTLWDPNRRVKHGPYS